MTSIYRTVYEVEVFSEGPFEVNGHGDSDPFDLEAISYAITDGECIGNVTRKDSAVVPPSKVRDELLRIGNDGGFFEFV